MGNSKAINFQEIGKITELTVVSWATILRMARGENKPLNSEKLPGRVFAVVNFNTSQLVFDLTPIRWVSFSDTLGFSRPKF